MGTAGGDPWLPSSSTRPRRGGSTSSLQRSKLAMFVPPTRSDIEAGWRVEAWVKTGILLGFRLPGMTEVPRWTDPGRPRPVRLGTLDILDSDGAGCRGRGGAPWRVVPGGTSVRSGVHLEPSVTIMPPAFANVGAWVGRGLDDRFACPRRLVCTSRPRRSPLGRGPGRRRAGAGRSTSGDRRGWRLPRWWRRHLRGRHREPGAVIAAGTILTGQSRLIDLVTERELRGTPESPAVVPAGAVVIPGTRPATSA